MFFSLSGYCFSLVQSMLFYLLNEIALTPMPEASLLTIKCLYPQKPAEEE